MKRELRNSEMKSVPGISNLTPTPLGPPPPPVPSDRRLKRDINPLARLPDGTKLYSFSYLWSETAYVGVMAQDLLGDPQRADAVSKLPNGYYAVDYHKIGLRMATLEDWNALGFEAVAATTGPPEAAETRVA